MPIDFDSSHSLWLALVVGNTRLHWGLFEAQRLIAIRHTPHLVTANDIQAMVGSGFDYGFDYGLDYPDRRRPQALWFASVVPEQTAICLASAIACRAVERSHIPLANLYATLGIDRAINLLGAKARVGWPVVVIDAGTALTFTAGYDLPEQPEQQIASSNQSGAAVYGGAILPGMRLQAEALEVGTAALKAAVMRSQCMIDRSVVNRSVINRSVADRSVVNRGELPTRWASSTEGAIASGLVYGAIATLTDMLSDWWQRFPGGKAVLTGGDGPQLYRFLQQKTPAIAARVSLDSELMFYGMSAYRQSLINRV